ncbi:two-component system sensor histidine kinase KdpD [Beggiatoa leptomitoformis]|uniref:histidine kinase n=1 Tax=Beggiatoa leptomitoformis TaxID=288004 RepID=A0A2N9YHX5_9GAMM|nr:two-component system sensor histidine kinase KdpD [Beggiatoa leptomitoformis]ALG67657.1 two-component system sensor histidine kinase KdbD [Beggiatoa leptomitoformis]AUI70107.1 two-component system sensor histidine kinase KdbD [Beggiatoa leptomitoformis]
MYPHTHQRPDPDVLLAQVQVQERRASRGKLRIYFGASAGVGKTYAMLTAARKLYADQQDLIVGIVETHGRSETLVLLEGLDVLPLKNIEYHGRMLTEFDIDAALVRHPALILVDELAHSNAPNSRHPKRWQDVEELLSVGIDVFTTVNVQHLESLNDVVGGITGVRVSETLPDTVFDKADEVVLVDIPADELLARLKAGKVYQIPQAERASHNFFRRGNLIALRELALRRTADRIEDDVQAYRVEKSINTVWKTDTALLACIGARSGDEHVIRSTARLANQLNTDWHVIYIETPQLQDLTIEQHARILKTLKLGEDLGARTAIVSGNHIAQEIIAYARSHNFSKIILGRNHRPTFWRSSTLQQIASLAPDIDLIELGRATETSATSKTTTSDASNTQSNATMFPQNFWHYLLAVLASLFTAAVATPLLLYLDLANIVMLFLLTVVLVAVRFGRGPAVTSTVVGVAAFDFFFVPPRFSFAVSDVQYVVTFAVMLVVGLITAHLTAGLRYQARIASRRESRSRALYEFARELSSALQTEQIFEMTHKFIVRTFRAQATLLLPDQAGRLQTPLNVAENTPEVTNNTLLDLGIAQWAFDHAMPAGVGTDTLPGSSFFYLPLVAPMRTRGVLAVQMENRPWILIPEQHQQLDTFAALTAIALERVHYIEVAQDALLHMESERLRNSLLSALSHDLRTPLTALVGLSESLLRSKPLTEVQQTLSAALHKEALRMSQLVSNLLDMARIQSGEVKLNLQWQALEEVVGSALRASDSFLGQHEIQLRMAQDLPLIPIDAVLIERVLCNLLENASKYTPAGSRITITAEVGHDFLDVAVNDNGPGLPVGKEETIFEKFTRGERESATPGIGLGLAICRAIIEAHGGTIRARQVLGGGASILFTLPLGTPPAMPEVDESELYHD